MNVARAIMMGIVCVVASTSTHAQEPGRPWSPTVGFEIYANNGDHVGYVVAAEVPEKRGHLVAELSRRLGFGSQTVIVPYDLVHEKGGRLVLTVSQEELEKHAVPLHDHAD